MGDVARPMLAECLAVVAERSAWAEHLSAWLRSDFARREHLYPGAWLDLDADEVCLRRRVPSKGLPPGDKRDVELLGWAPWTITDPAEAQETLVARGLLPEGWCDVARRGWHERQARDDGWGDWCDVVLPAPRTLPDLVAVASLGWDAVHHAEEYALEAPARLREYGCPQPKRVVWRVGYRMLPGDFAWRMRGTYGVQRDGAASFPGGVVGPVRPVAALWQMGLALDAIDRDAVRIVVPPVGGCTVKRRRIREIVADVLAVEEGGEARPEEVTITAGRERAPDTVRLGMAWGDVLGASKRDALQQLLALCGWREEWPGLTGDERWLLRRGEPFCAIARSQGRGDLWLWEHLREPVALPEEASRG